MALKTYPAGRAFTEKPKDAAELLARAREVLAPRGAWKHKNWTGTKAMGGKMVPQRCLVQALRDCDGELVGPTIDKYVIPAIQARFPERIGSGASGSNAVVGFNDNKATTKYDVLSVLEDARERAEGS